MYHHDKRDYAEALREAQAFLDKQIEIKSASAADVIDRVRRTQLVDRVVPTGKVRFSFRTDKVKVKDAGGAMVEQDRHRVLMGSGTKKADGAFSEVLHKHALDQAASRVDIPVTFVNRFLDEPYGGELITDAMNTVYKNRGQERFLVRSSDEEIRGVLSDTYRRMDSGPILDTFAETCQAIGARPIEGIGGELRFSVKALIPKTYVVGKPGNEEVFAFGVSLSNSDFGCGALALNFFLWRIWCSNTATRDDSLRKVHLGKRLGENIEYAKETYEADTRAMALMVRDHVRGILAPPKIDEALAAIEAAMDTSVEPKKFFDKGGELEKLKLTRAEIDSARETFNNGDITVLPRGTSVARMSQAVAWLAQTVPSAERRLELERVAGVIMERPIEAQAA
jgi:hypothetical protein